MSQYDIAVIGGDGIGPEVTREAMKVVDTAADVFGFKLNRHEFPFGTDHYLATGDIFPDKEFEEARAMNAIFLGAIGDPRVPVGLIEYGIIAKMRFDLDLFANVRPVKLYDERLCPLKDEGPADIDMVIVRENTEGAYAGMHGFAHKNQPLEVSTQTMVYTREATERVIRFAFDLAMDRGGRRQVTLIDKANAIRAHDLWTRTFAEVAAEYPECKTDHAYVDAACMWMVKNPEWFDVAVCPNLVGDIVSDLGAMLMGGMGIAASSNVHPGRVGLFEPIHGSAPKHAGKNVASPAAAIMAGSMMLSYLGEKKAAKAIEKVISDLFISKKLKGVGTAVHKTDEVGDMVAAELKTVAASV